MTLVVARNQTRTHRQHPAAHPGYLWPLEFQAFNERLWPSVASLTIVVGEGDNRTRSASDSNVSSTCWTSMPFADVHELRMVKFSHPFSGVIGRAIIHNNDLDISRKGPKCSQKLVTSVECRDDYGDLGLHAFGYQQHQKCLRGGRRRPIRGVRW